MDPHWPLNQPHPLNPHNTTQRRGLVHPRRVVRFGTYNARTLHRPGDAELLAADLHAAGVDVCGLQEVRRRGTGNIALASEGPAARWRLLWCGPLERHIHGVGALLSPAAAAALTDYTALSERLMLLRFCGGAIKVSVVVAYAPTEVSPARTKDGFYRELRGLLDSIPAHHMVVLLGDMNARVGADTTAWRGVIGGWGFPMQGPPLAGPLGRGTPASPCTPLSSRSPSLPGSPMRSPPPPGPPAAAAAPAPAAAPEQAAAPTARRRRWRPARHANDNGRRCLQLCTDHGLVVGNTFFRHPDASTATWRAPGGENWATIDLVLVSRRFRSSVLNVQALPAAVSHSSDHTLVVCDMRLRLKAAGRPGAGSRRAPRMDIHALQHNVLAQAAFSHSVASSRAQHSAAHGALTDANTELQAMLQAVRAAQQFVPPLPPQQHRPWISATTCALSVDKRAAYAAWQQLRDSPPPADSQGRQHHEAQEVAARALYKDLCRLTRSSAAADHSAYTQGLAAHMHALHMQRRPVEAFKVLNSLTGRKQRSELTSLSTVDGLQHGAEALQAMAGHMRAVLNVPAAFHPGAYAALCATGGPAAAEVLWGALGLSAEQALCIARAALATEGLGATAEQQQQQQQQQQPRTRAQHVAAAAPGAWQAQHTTPSRPAWPCDDTEPTLAEVQAAANRLRNSSAPGEEGLPPFLLKCPEVVAWMHRVIIATWRGGRAPDSWRHALLVAIWKGKGSRLLADNYRGIALISLTSKIYVHMLHQRVQQQLLAGLQEAQCGFRPGRGTQDQLFSLRRVLELAREHQAPVHAAFVDFSKAFDSVPRDALWELLRARGVHPHLLALIKDLYSSNTASVAEGSNRSPPFPMRTGVRQGCPLSPLLFNVWMDFICRQVADACSKAGVHGYTVAYRIDGRLTAPPRCNAALQLLMLLYADDVVLLGPSPSALRSALLAMESTASMWGMQLSHAKTMVMVCAPDARWAAATSAAEAATAARDGGEGAAAAAAAAATAAVTEAAAAAATSHPACALEHGTLGLVSSFKYLGGLCDASGSQERELGRRLRAAGDAFKQLQPRVFRCSRVGLRTKLMLYKAVVLSVLLYGAAESWALTESQVHRLSVFHTTCLRRIMRVSRLDMVSNEELCSRAGMPCMAELLSRHRLRWLGHLARMPNERWAKQLLFSHEVPRGARRVGRPHMVWADSVRADLASRQSLLSGRNWYTVAQDRAAWQAVVAGQR